MAEQRIHDYYRVLNQIRGCERVLNNFRQAFSGLEQTKQEIFDDPARKAALIELIELDGLVTIAELQAAYQKYKTADDWLEAQE